MAKEVPTPPPPPPAENAQPIEEEAEAVLAGKEGAEKKEEQKEKAEALSPAQKLASLKEDLDFRLIDKSKTLLEMLSRSDSYEKGDWKEINRQFYSAFEDLKGGKYEVTEEEAQHLLEHFQKTVFSSLGLEGDRFAKPDGKIGPYSLYAFAMYFQMRRPKETPNLQGNPKLAKLIEEDVKTAYDQYVTRFDLQGVANFDDFKKQYSRIVTTSRYFNPEKAKFADWMEGVPGYKVERTTVGENENPYETYYELARGHFYNSEGKPVKFAEILPQIAQAVYDPKLYSGERVYRLDTPDGTRYYDPDGKELSGIPIA